MKKSIVIKYKNGSSVNIEVLSDFYIKKYPKADENKREKIFISEYKKFLNALSKPQPIINIGSYLKFSNATISGEGILSVDIVDDNQEIEESNTVISEVNPLNLIAEVLQKLDATGIISNLDTLLKKINNMMAKNNVDITIKASNKKATTAKAINKANSASINIPSVIDALDNQK